MIRIPGLATVKTWAIAGLGILASIMSILFYRKKAQHESAKRKGIEKVREQEKKATEAMIEGLEQEQEKLKDEDNTVGKRTYLE